MKKKMGYTSKKKMSYMDGGSKKKMSYNDGDEYMSPRKAGMKMMGKKGGLMGYMNGGSVLDPIMKEGDYKDHNYKK
jgi:hypothetical protein